MTVAKHNYPYINYIGDVREVSCETINGLEPIDIVFSGSPCQDLSKAKSNRENLNGKRSNLFFEFVRILDYIKENINPNVKFLFENVKMDKESESIITEALGVEPVRINSVLVSAQRRERLYWTNIGEITQPEDKGLKIKDIVYDNTYKVFTDPRIDASKSNTKNYIKYDLSGKGYYSQQDRAYYLDGTMCTVMKANPTNKLNIYLGDDTYRRCHPIEAERLQTLNDNYTSIIDSHGKRIGLVGDGWTVDVIVHILSHWDSNSEMVELA